MTPGGPAGGGSGTIATGAVDAPTEPAPMIATIRSDGSTASCPLLPGSDAAGIGIDEAGVTRLPALDARGIAAGTVAAASARIGDARSTYEDGILTRINSRAAALGIAAGMMAREFVAITRRAAAQRGTLA